MALCSAIVVVLMLDMTLINVGDSNKTADFLSAQSDLRAYIEQTQNSDLGNLVNQMNAGLEKHQIVSTEALYYPLILTLAMFAMTIVHLLGIPNAIVRTVQSRRQTVTLPRNTEVDHETPVNHALSEISVAADQLKSLYSAEQSTSHHELDRNELEAKLSDIIDLSGYMRAINDELDNVKQSFSSVENLLGDLSVKCGEYAHFATATRIEWSMMGKKLRDVTEHHEKIKTLSEKASKAQIAVSDSLQKSLEFNKIYSNHSENVSTNLGRLFENTKIGYNNLDAMSKSVSVSKVDVNKAAELVKGLSQRAEAIVNIIDVIDDIAEQTNQLALNASIEAARAGEQGQGFAVVAGEVRNLAARSSTATRSITDLLETIQDEADHASRLLEKSNEAVSDSYNRIREVDQSYRDSIILARHSVNGLDTLLTDVNNHFMELKQIEKLNGEKSKISGKLYTLLAEHSELASSLNTEGNQLTVYSDRVSRLLSRQFHELTHCQKLFSITDSSLTLVKNKASSGENKSNQIKGFIDQLYRDSFKSPSINNLNQIAILTNLEKLKSSSRSIRLLTTTHHQPAQVQSLSEDRNQDIDDQTPPSSEVSEDQSSTIVSKLPEEDVYIGSKGDGNKNSTAV